jgi:hypothetical protein
MPVGNSEAAQKQREAYIAHQNTIRGVDPFMYDAELGAAEGTSSNGIGGDFTANLPERIQGSPHEVRPDIEKYGDQAGMHARAAELKRTIGEIDTKAESMRPGELSNTEFAEAGPSQMVIVDANRAKFEKMKRESEDMARKQHEDKYGLSSQFGGGGFAGVGRL